MMLDKFENYLTTVGATCRDMTKRVEDLLAVFTSTGMMSDIEEIYVSEHRQSGGSARTYEHLLLFSRDRIGVAEHFLSQDVFKVTSRDQIRELTIEPENYSLWDKPTVKSRLTIRAYDANGVMVVDGTGTSENCAYLKKLALRYWAPCTRP